MANEYLTTTNNIEVLGSVNSDAQISSLYVQVLNNGSTPDVQVSSMYIQVLRSIAEAPAITRRRQMVQCQ